MTIEEQLRDLGRCADRRQSAITAAEILERAGAGSGSFSMSSTVNGSELLDHTPLQSSDRDTNVIDLEGPGATDERADGSKRGFMAGLVAVAAAAIVVAGIGAIAYTVTNTNADDPDGVPQAPAPTAAPTTVAPTTTAAPVTVTGHVSGTDPFFAVTYTLPDGWTDDGSGVMAHGESSVVNFWTIGDVYADGCEWTKLDPPLGPTVDDLATVWAELPGFTSTTPVDITIDGYAGKQVDYNVPDYDEADCVDGRFALWTEATGSAEPDFWAQVPLQQNRQWIIDVDGTRLVINEWSEPGTTPEQLAATDELIASIQIG